MQFIDFPNAFTTYDIIVRFRIVLIIHFQHFHQIGTPDFQLSKSLFHAKIMQLLDIDLSCKNFYNLLILQYIFPEIFFQIFFILHNLLFLCELTFFPILIFLFSFSNPICKKQISDLYYALSTLLLELSSGNLHDIVQKR